MQEINEKELKQINGGGVGAFLVGGAIIVGGGGGIDGIVRPLACRS